MNILRIGGMVSGLDTEQMVRDLMRVERLRTDRLLQQRQTVTWQKEQYREIINSVRRFRDTYFNFAAPDTNLLSSAAVIKLRASSSGPQVTVSAGADAQAGESTFRVINSAAAARAVSADVSVAGLDLSHTMEQVNQNLRSATKMTFGQDGNLTLNINGADIIINKNDTLRTALGKISSSAGNVSAHYSSFSDTFTFTAKNTGAGFITTDDGGNFFSALGLAPAAGNIGQAGADAVFEINGVQGSRPGNTFTIDGVTYAINAGITAPTEVISISVTADTAAVYRLIEGFVNDYNTLIGAINGRLNEERFRDFPPLTDSQKEEMSETEIARWEERAKSGLLRGEPALENLLRNMRRAVSEAVGGLHLTGLGIHTSRNYLDNGRLVLADGGNALRAAIENNPDRVAELFSRRSAIDYSPNLTFEQRAIRRAESGLAHRLSDVLNDNIRTLRDSGGRKGILLEIAGTEGDATHAANFLAGRINAISERLARTEELLARREEMYYRQFAAMEKALQQLYAQGDWLQAQLNQGWNQA